MNQGKYVFAQIAEFLPRRVFDRLVLKYNGNKFVRVFSCWNQMLSLIFGLLTSRDGFRIISSLLFCEIISFLAISLCQLLNLGSIR